jgi:hypothetical protein
VIDPLNHRITARGEVPGYPVALLGDDHLATYREDRDGIPYVDVWRITSRD